MFRQRMKKQTENKESKAEKADCKNEETFFIKLPMYESFKRSIDRRDPIKEEVIKLLKGIDMFRELKDRELKKIYTEFHFREYKKNEYIFKEGNPCGAVFIVRSGEISIQSTKTLTDKPNRFNMKCYTEIYAKVTAGGMFGETAFLNENAHRTADAVCIEPAEVIVLFSKSLLDFFKKEQVICQKVFKSIVSIQSQKLENTNSELLEAKLQNKKLMDYINSLQNESSPTIKSVDEIIL